MPIQPGRRWSAIGTSGEATFSDRRGGTKRRPPSFARPCPGKTRPTGPGHHTRATSRSSQSGPGRYAHQPGDRPGQTGPIRGRLSAGDLAAHQDPAHTRSGRLQASGGGTRGGASEARQSMSSKKTTGGLSTRPPAGSLQSDASAECTQPAVLFHPSTYAVDATAPDRPGPANQW